MEKKEIRREDGRYLIYYSFEDEETTEEAKERAPEAGGRASGKADLSSPDSSDK